jgi:hypothetical protein
MGFNFPHPPDHLTFPQTAQHVANAAMAVLVLAFVVYGVLEWRRGRGPLCLLLVAGGSVSYLNEPILDVLGPLWHPRPGQDVAFTTFGPVPLWGLGIYTVFFGGGTYVMYRLLEHGVTRRQLWLGIGAFWVVNLAVELPLLQAGLYTYYGYRTPPMSVGGLPLFWLVVNCGSPLAGACLLRGMPQLVAGWRVVRAVLLPMTAYGAFALASGWPVFSAAHAPHLPGVVDWAAALLTIGIGASIIHELAGWAERTGPVRTAEPARAEAAEAAEVAAAARILDRV